MVCMSVECACVCMFILGAWCVLLDTYIQIYGILSMCERTSQIKMRISVFQTHRKQRNEEWEFANGTRTEHTFESQKHGQM